MMYVGIDLHKHFIMLTAIDKAGNLSKPKRFECSDESSIYYYFEEIQPFRAVIEASGSYRWLYDLLSPIGEVVLAHPARLRAIVSGRAKTDKLDSSLLATLLRANMIPTAYIPPARYQVLRDLTRARCRLVRRMTQAKNEVHALLRQRNIHSPYSVLFCKSGKKWTAQLDMGPVINRLRDELLRRVEHFEREIARFDAMLQEVVPGFPEHEALTDIHGIGLYSAMLIIGEIGEPHRFANGRQVGAYAGLTARVSQSGNHSYHGHITRQGSPWLRWILVEAAIKVVRKDEKLKNFYTRIRKRSSAKIARVATARKLASICWIRLINHHRKEAVAA